MENLKGIFKDRDSFKIRKRGLKEDNFKPSRNPMLRAALGEYRAPLVYNKMEKDQSEEESDNSPTKDRMRNKQIKRFKPEMYVREGITKEEVIEFKAAFDLFDADGGGTIDPLEMIDAMKDLAVPMHKETILEFFHRKKKDGNQNMVQSNEIGFDEMINMMTITNKDETEEELREVFSMFDIFEKGYIDLDTLKEVAKQMGELVQEGDLEQMISKADRTGNGKVYFEDFLYLIRYVD